MTKPLRILFLLTVLLANSACSNIPIKDVTLYWPMGPDGAAVTHTLSDGTSQMTKAEWDAFSDKTVAMLYEDFGWFRGTLEKLCSEHKGMCKPEMQAKLTAFVEKTKRDAKRTKRREG